MRTASTVLAERDDDRVEVGPERVAAEIDEDVAPGMERRLEVDEGQVERAVVDLDRQLERGDQHPVERQQHDERPEARAARRSATLGAGAWLVDARRLEQAAHQRAAVGAHAWYLRAGRTTKLKKETQVTVETKRSM